MRDGLKIYACSGLCNQIGTAAQDFQYWRDDTVTTSNTRAVNSLLADINQIEAQLQYKRDMTDDEVLYALNRIDLLVVCLMFAQGYNKAELPLAGRVIADMLQEGMFNNTSLDDGERDEYLITLCQTAEQRFVSGDVTDIDNDFTAWFEKNITSQSYVGLTETQQERAQNFFEKQSGVGATEKGDAANLLFNVGEYYLYLYMTRAQAYKEGYKIGKKWDKQREVYQYVHKCYDPIYGSPEAVDKVIYTGICKQLHNTPEYAIKQLTGYKSTGVAKGVGIDPALISAIAALITAIVTALALILDFVAQVVAVKYQQPTNAEGGTPEDYEWTEPTQSGMSKWAILAAGIALLAAAFGTTYKKTKKS